MACLFRNDFSSGVSPGMSGLMSSLSALHESPAALRGLSRRPLGLCDLAHLPMTPPNEIVKLPRSLDPTITNTEHRLGHRHASANSEWEHRFAEPRPKHYSLHDPLRIPTNQVSSQEIEPRSHYNVTATTDRLPNVNMRKL
jgi:hypothetical protein